MPWRELLFGRPLRTEEEQVEQIGPLSGIPVLGLDALASAAYGPEATLTVLLPLGALASGYIGLITLCIVALLLAVFVSYRQTIPAYPQGGGSFTVAKENLGRVPGLLAASALSVDYILNVAVAISTGVGALVSALPPLLPFTLPICLLVLALLTIINLRGIRTAGLLFMAPTYLFVGCLGTTILIGIIKTILAHGHPVAVIQPPQISPITTTAATWLLLRAFASGCTALTGVEAVSNAVPIFRQPSVVLAKRALTIIIAILAFLLVGEAILSHAYRFSATPPGQAGYQSVLSQMVGAVMGRGAFYYLALASILLVAALSANTSFAGFPRVCRVLALDEYLPAEFAHRGSRLVYTTGIIVLTLLSAILLVIFRGITDRLIPLFAVGAFLAFTLSQSGMVAHWWRKPGPHARRSLALNAAGALATATTLIIIAVSKFREGAWVIILIIAALVIMLLRIRHYHEKVESDTNNVGALNATGVTAPIVVIPLKRLDEVARKALRLALGISREVYAIQVLSEEMQTEDLSHSWSELVERPAREAGYRPPRLVVLASEYREFFGPFLDYIDKLGAEHTDRPIAVMLPEVVERRWYHFIFRHRNTVLKGLLLLRGGPRILIITTPWYLREPPPQTPPGPPPNYQQTEPQIEARTSSPEFVTSDTAH